MKKEQKNINKKEGSKNIAKALYEKYKSSFIALKKYDKGEKEIQTSHLRRRLQKL